MPSPIRESEPLPVRAIMSAYHRKAHAIKPSTQAHKWQFFLHDTRQHQRISKFRQVGATKVHSPAQLVYTLDHDIQNSSAAYVRKIEAIEAFAAEQDVTWYGKGRGIGHQVGDLYTVQNLTSDFRIDYGGGRLCLAGHHGGGFR